MTHFHWVPYQMLSPDRPGPEQFCLRTACGVWGVGCGVWCVGAWLSLENIPEPKSRGF